MNSSSRHSSTNSKNLLCTSHIVIVYEHINFPIKASIITFRIDFTRLAGFSLQMIVTYDWSTGRALYLWGCADFFTFFCSSLPHKERKNRGKQKQIAPNYQRYEEMWMNNDAHENNAKKDGWRSEKNTSAWVHQGKKNSSREEMMKSKNEYKVLIRL